MIISSTTRKGGVLKTSMTVNLAGALANMGKRVLIIDTDAQGDCFLSFGLNPDQVSYTLYDLLIYGTKPERSILQITKNIDMIASNDDMISFDFEVIGNPNKYPKPFDLMKDKLRNILWKYDYVLIDSPGHFGLIQGNILSIADRVLIPFQPEVYSMRSLIKIIAAINEFKETQKVKVEIAGIVATMVDQKTVLHSDILAKARAYCLENDIKIFDSVIPKSIRYASSIAFDSMPTTLSDPNHPLAKIYYELAKEVILNDNKKITNNQG